jgi:predicted SprT family Zn-dependent metalloprotease
MSVQVINEELVKLVNKLQEENSKLKKENINLKKKIYDNEHKNIPDNICNDIPEKVPEYVYKNIVNISDSDSDNDNFADEKIKYTEKEINHLMTHYGLIQNGWTYEYNNRLTTAGMTYYNSKKIEISKKYVSSKYTSKKCIKNTILHEIAHALVGKGHGHNNIWKSKAIEIGCDGERCFDNPMSDVTKYCLVCPKGCNIGRCRMGKDYLEGKKNYICKKHGMRVTINKNY